MRKHGGVPFGPDAGELLRARGLRVTPQRRAILGAFSHGADEHLSADEIHARAAAVVPELGRGTVYAALAELTELGLLAARGSPEPVRYETNTEPHQHFRCRLCLRLFDVELADPALGLAAEGFVVEQIAITGGGRLRGVRRLRQGPALRREARAPPSVGRPPGGGGRDDRRHAGGPAHARRDGRRRGAVGLRRPRRRARAAPGGRRPPREPGRPRAPRRGDGGRRGVLRRRAGRRVHDRLGPARRRAHAARGDGRAARAARLLRRARHAGGRARARSRARLQPAGDPRSPATA